MKNSTATARGLSPAGVHDALSLPPGLAMALFRTRGSDVGDRVATIVRGVAQASADRIEVTDIDAEAQLALAAHYYVTQTPTVLVLKDGVVVDRVVGAATSGLLERLLQSRAPRDADRSFRRETKTFRRETPCSVWKRGSTPMAQEVAVKASVGDGIEVECGHGA